MSAKAPTANFGQETAGFIAALFPPDGDGFVELRALPRKDQRFVRAGDLETIWEFLNAHPRQNLYFGLAARRTQEDGTLANCGALCTVWVDIDFKALPESTARESLGRFPLPPSIIVRSGGGLHVYWLLREAVDVQTDAPGAKNILRRLAHHLGGDLASAEPARVLRVPGTLNYKYNPPRPVVLELFEPGRRYNRSEFEWSLPEEPPGNSQGQPFTLPKRVIDGQRNDILYRLGRALKAKGASHEAILAALKAENASRCEPPLQEQEVAEIAHHCATQADRRDFQPQADRDGADATPVAYYLAPLESLSAASPPEAFESGLRAVASMLRGRDRLKREIVRHAAVARLEQLDVGAPARLVDAAFTTVAAELYKLDERQGQSLILSDPEPWPEPVNGADLLEALTQVLTRFVVLPDGATTAIALWIMNAHAHEACEISPLLAAISPVMRCGKTTVFIVIGVLVPRPLFASNITAAAMFRTVEECVPTLLVDEADTFLALSDEMRGLLNAGHTRQTASVVRTVGDNHEPRQFSTWCPKAIALIGKLPRTLKDRAITIEMRRRRKEEPVERFRDKKLRKLEPIRRQAARWAQDHLAALREADPKVPEELDDRTADNWRPLFAVADLVGGDWPHQAREMAKLLSGAERETDADGIQLLADICDLFREQQTDRLQSAKVVEALTRLEERPWGEWKHGKPLTQRQLAGLLKPFRIEPKRIRTGSTTRGYERAQFEDAFARYLPPEAQFLRSDPSQATHANKNADLGLIFDPPQPPSVADQKSDLTTRKERSVADVADRNTEYEAEGDTTEPGWVAGDASPAYQEEF